MHLASWTDVGGYYAYDPATNQTTDTHLQPRGPYDQPGDLVAEEVRVRAPDGVMVPLSIIHKKGMVLDGTNPCWLEAYGSYGIVDTPYFSPIFLPWYEHGGIYAVAHVRGGGAFGEEWHLAGQKLNKPNTWRDLIACAQWLIDNNYTSTPKLGINGGSAGGITVGRAMTERPDLFGAVVGDVGMFNAVRAETDSNGVPNISEFGTRHRPGRVSRPLRNGRLPACRGRREISADAADHRHQRPARAALDAGQIRRALAAGRRAAGAAARGLRGRPRHRLDAPAGPRRIRGHDGVLLLAVRRAGLPAAMTGRGGDAEERII